MSQYYDLTRGYYVYNPHSQSTNANTSTPPPTIPRYLPGYGTASNPPTVQSTNDTITSTPPPTIPQYLPCYSTASNPPMISQYLPNSKDATSNSLYTRTCKHPQRMLPRTLILPKTLILQKT